MLTTALVSCLLASTPQVGDPAPDFQLTDTAGQRFVLSDALRRGPVVLAFFPKAFTGG